MTRMLGLRNIVCTKEDWLYLVFYDIDRNVTEQEEDMINQIAVDYNLSYILYKTKHGVHFVSLTPTNAIIWAECFTEFKRLFNSYYSGNVIRLSQKKDEKQELIHIRKVNEIIPNLYNLYAKRFNYDKLPWQRETAKYLLVFEKYRSVKE